MAGEDVGRWRVAGGVFGEGNGLPVVVGGRGPWGWGVVRGLLLAGRGARWWSVVGVVAAGLLIAGWWAVGRGDVVQALRTLEGVFEGEAHLGRSYGG